MRNLFDKYRTLAFTTVFGVAALLGVSSEKAAAQYYDNDNYNNNGYNNGYNNNGYNNGYGNNDGYYDNNGYSGYNNDYTAFYNDLAPYGQWFRDPQYGMVWCPRVGRDFMPYQSNGYWAMTQYGNTWMSNYNWGWAAFHYGRWTYDSYYGWIWIPGNEWGPAWVNWRSGGGYYGWAPLGPGISISMSFGFNAPMNWWTFVPQSNIYYTGGYSRWHNNYGNGNVYNIYNNTTVINNYNNYGGRNYIVGPSRGDVERSVRRPISVYNLNDGQSRGRSSVRGSNISMYRPNVSSIARSTNTRSIDTRNVQTLNRGNRNTPGQQGTAPGRNNNNNNGVRTPGNAGNNYDRGARMNPPVNNNEGYQRRNEMPNRNVAPAPVDNRPRDMRMQPQQPAPAPNNRVYDNGNRMNRSRDMQSQPAPVNNRVNMNQPAPSRNYERAPQQMPQRQYDAPKPSMRSEQQAPAPQRPAMDNNPSRGRGDQGGRPSGGGMDRGYRR